MPGSQLVKLATFGVAGALAVWFIVALKAGGVDRAVLIGFCLAPTAITFHFAHWLERVERTVRIRFLPADTRILLATRTGVACSLLALTWSAVGSLATFNLTTAVLVLGPVMASLFLASLSIGAAVDRVVTLAEAA